MNRGWNKNYEIRQVRWLLDTPGLTLSHMGCVERLEFIQSSHFIINIYHKPRLPQNTRFFFLFLKLTWKNPKKYWNDVKEEKHLNKLFRLQNVRMSLPLFTCSGGIFHSPLLGLSLLYPYFGAKRIYSSVFLLLQLIIKRSLENYEIRQVRWLLDTPGLTLSHMGCVERLEFIHNSHFIINKYHNPRSPQNTRFFFLFYGISFRNVQ